MGSNRLFNKARMYVFMCTPVQVSMHLCIIVWDGRRSNLDAIPQEGCTLYIFNRGSHWPGAQIFSIVAG